MAQLKWDCFDDAIKKLNDRASSVQAKYFGLADDLAAVREALAQLQRNVIAVQTDNLNLHQQLQKFLSQGATK